MSNKTHWLKNPNKNYLGHWDLPNNDLILTIERAGWEDVKDPVKNTVALKRVIHFKEKYKPLICNETNAKSIYASTGIRYIEDSKGAKIALFVGEEYDRKNKITIECVRVRPNKLIPPKTIEDYPEDKKNLEKAIDLNELKKTFLGFSVEKQKLFNDLKNELKGKLS